MHEYEVCEDAHVGFWKRTVPGELIWQFRLLFFIMQQGRRWAADEASGLRLALSRWAGLMSAGGGSSVWPYLERLSCCSTAQVAMRPATLVR